MVQFTRAKTFSDYEKIKALQNANLRNHLSLDELRDQGFLTASYSLEYLQKMNEACPSIIAMDGETLAGYALVAVQSIRKEHELLDDLFNHIDKAYYKNTPLADTSYVVVGQICVGKNYRGRGLVQQLYSQFKEDLWQEYDYCITDVHQFNHRSMKAHLKTGFQIIGDLYFGSEPFNLILWDWNNKAL